MPSTDQAAVEELIDMDIVDAGPIEAGLLRFPGNRLNGGIAAANITGAA
jgi:hypothetical protein